MKILIDAMGGDNSPDEIIKGSVNAIDELESEIVLMGKEELINHYHIILNKPGHYTTENGTIVYKIITIIKTLVLQV